MIKKNMEAVKKDNLFKNLNERITFQIALLFAPLSYCIHQLEESLGGFRTWRLRHFPNNNPLPVEYVFVILTAISLIFIILFSIRKSKATARVVLFLFMMTQVNNALYHVGTGLFFWDYSPGTITGLLLYLTANIYVLIKAIEEKWISKINIIILFLLGAIGFWIFEMGGPIFIAIIFVLVVIYLIFSELKEKRLNNN
jgi:uncharacterized membrane protein YoaK (UPF0700 family)